MSMLSEIFAEMGKKNAQELLDRIVAGEINDTGIIDEEMNVPFFDPDKDYTDYPRGFAVRDEGQVYGLLQPYNASYYPQRPAELPALWGLKHTKNPERAKPFVAPLGISGLYFKDECCLFEGTVYISLQDNNAYSPEEYPPFWREWEGNNETEIE